MSSALSSADAAGREGLAAAAFDEVIGFLAAASSGSATFALATGTTLGAGTGFLAAAAAGAASPFGAHLCSKQYAVS